MKKNWISWVLILIMAIFMALLMIDLVPLLFEVAQHIADETVVAEEIHMSGLQGALLLIGLQALQIVTIVFPSIAIQILAGIAYGTLWGWATCLAGYILGNTLVFALSRQLANVFVGFVPPLKIKSNRAALDLTFIQESRNASILAFILFLIPGIPNGILPYIFARTKISLTKYLLCILLAATPTILISTSIGNKIAQGQIKFALGILIALSMFTIVIFLMRKKLFGFLKRH